MSILNCIFGCRVRHVWILHLSVALWFFFVRLEYELRIWISFLTNHSLHFLLLPVIKLFFMGFFFWSFQISREKKKAFEFNWIRQQRLNYIDVIKLSKSRLFMRYYGIYTVSTVYYVCGNPVFCICVVVSCWFFLPQSFIQYVLNWTYILTLIINMADMLRSMDSLWIFQKSCNKRNKITYVQSYPVQKNPKLLEKVLLT